MQRQPSPPGDHPQAQDLVTHWGWIQSHPQPVAPMHEVTEPFQALGVAAFHAGGAVSQYIIILEAERPDQDVHMLMRYQQAEADARNAQVVLHRIYSQLAQSSQYHSELRKNCRQLKLWLSENRSHAAWKIGVQPPPVITDNVTSPEIDRHYFQE